MKEQAKNQYSTNRLKRFKNYYQQGQLKHLVAEASSDIDGLQKEELELSGLASLKLADHENAISFLNRLLLRRQRAEDHFHAGLAFAGIGNHKQAIEHFKKASEKEQVRPAAWLQEARSWLSLGDPDHALAALKKLHNQSNPTAHSTLLAARVSYLKGQYQRALSLVDEFPELATQPEAQVLKAASLLKAGDIPTAIALYRQLAERYPQKAEHWYNLAAALSNSTNQTELAESIEMAKKCLVLKPGHSQARYTIALAHRKRGELTLAKQWLEELVTDYPNAVEIKEKLAETMSDLSQHEQAISLLAEKQITGASPTWLRTLGIALARNADYKKAQITLDQARKLDNRDQRTLAYLAITQLAQGKSKQAKELTDSDRLLKQFNLLPVDEYSEMEGFNSELATDIKNHSRLRFNPAGLAARNGYLTSDLLADKTPAITAFHRMLLKAIDQYIAAMPDDKEHPFYCHKSAALKHGYVLNIWATWTQEEGYIDKHIHEESWISGTYYVTVPEVTRTTQGKEGFFEFGCIPNDIPLNHPTETGCVRPKTGQLLIFPSYLFHQTIPHGSEEDRISIAFDLTPKHWIGLPGS